VISFLFSVILVKTSRWSPTNGQSWLYFSFICKFFEKKNARTPFPFSYISD